MSNPEAELEVKANQIIRLGEHLPNGGRDLVALIRAVVAQDILVAMTKALGRRESPGNVLLQYADEHGATIPADEPPAPNPTQPHTRKDG